MTSKIKIITIIGARPQFIKASSLTREIKRYRDISEIIIHTGQHFDKNMSDVFFEEMEIPKPKYNLGISSSNHGDMTGRMIIEIEKILLLEKPELVIVYGDTNSTLAGALAARKLNITIAHIEAGLRSFNQLMPEEINRILTDRISDYLFCPSLKAITNLKNEGFESFPSKVTMVGDIMKDSALYYKKIIKKPNIEIENDFILATIHRAENTNDKNRFVSIIESFNELSKNFQLIVPLHPRSQRLLDNLNLTINFDIVEPVGYLEMLWLIKNSKIVLTDSGGLQKEAYFFKKFCITLRDETEWIELVEAGYNKLVGANSIKIVDAVYKYINTDVVNDEFYGDGRTSKYIIEQLLKTFNEGKLC